MRQRGAKVTALVINDLFLNSMDIVNLQFTKLLATSDMTESSPFLKNISSDRNVK
jgi:hypothetical protein